MRALVRFWRQPCRRYRNFQIAFTLLTLNFAIPAIGYALAPELTHEQFVQLNAMLGGAEYTFDEPGSRFWRYLGTANVMSLAFMCLLLQIDLRAFRMVLIPLTFLKSTAATLWLCGFLAAPEYPACLAAAILDYVTSAAFLYFGLTALFELRAHGTGDDIVPRLPSDHPLGWTPSETRWGQSLMSAMIPASGQDQDQVAGVSSLDLEGFWSRFAQRAPTHLRLGFRAVVWALTFLPVLSRWHRPFHRLSPEGQDDFLKHAAASPIFLVRQLVTTLKMITCMAYFGDRDRRGALL